MASGFPLTTVAVTSSDPPPEESGLKNMEIPRTISPISESDSLSSLNVTSSPSTVSTSSAGSNTRSSKRSSSISNDSLYERDRFRARLHNFNVTNESCDVCDIIGTKTAKLNVHREISPLSSESSFYKLLEAIPSSYKDLLIKSIKVEDLRHIFDWYFNKPLPETAEMFPWLHGLQSTNLAQREFFIQQTSGNVNIDVKPKSRFLMTISCSDDTTLLRNNTTVSEILCPIDVSREEAKQVVRSMMKKAFSQLDESFFDAIIADMSVVNHLPIFLNLDPEKGVSLRNFHIQVTKSATCSDFIVYCFDRERLDYCYSLARLLWLAQRLDGDSGTYNVFILTDFSGRQLDEQLRSYNILPKISSKNFNINRLTKLRLDHLNKWDNEYILKEKVETLKMSSATKLNGQLYSGNVWDYQNFINFKYSLNKDLIHKKMISINNLYCNPLNSITTASAFREDDLIETILPLPNLKYRLFVNCFNDAKYPDETSLENLLKVFNENGGDRSIGDYYCLSFPSSGSMSVGSIKLSNIISIINTCKLLYLVSHVKKRDCLIYCSDGYTELSVLNLYYLIYLLNISVNEAILKLHQTYGRPFYIFNTDVSVLKKLEPLLRKVSPAKNSRDWNELETLAQHETNYMLVSSDYDTSSSSSSSDDSFVERPLDWAKSVEGSLPSRILPYLYLGSLKHANCLPMLKELGITKIISVGEPLLWLGGSRFERQNEITIETLNDGDIELYNIKPRDEFSCSGIDQIMKVNNLQDDGIDQLESSLPAILDYIDKEYKRSHGQTKILVHCRVGVSRSATVVIAEVMRRLKINLPKAYLYVRVRRLNIIIQPNLKFMYELFKWEELHKLADDECLREIDWFAMCREITQLNNPYLR